MGRDLGQQAGQSFAGRTCLVGASGVEAAMEHEVGGARGVRLSSSGGQVRRGVPGTPVLPGGFPRSGVRSVH